MNRSIRLALALSLASTALLAAGTARAAPFWYDCQPDEVLEFSNRVHVRCTNPVAAGADNVRFLAINKTDLNKVARFLTLVNAAFLSGHPVRAEIDSASTGNVAGCGAVDCRTPTAFGLGL